MITPRQMHSMTAVFSHMVVDQSRYLRSLWAYPYQPRNFEKEQLVYDTSLMGIYMFGGLAYSFQETSAEDSKDPADQTHPKSKIPDSKLYYSNELFLIKPDY